MSLFNSVMNCSALLLITSMSAPPKLTLITPRSSNVWKIPVPNAVRITRILIVKRSSSSSYVVTTFVALVPIVSMSCASSKNACSGEMTKSVSISNVSTIICAPVPSFKSYV